MALTEFEMWKEVYRQVSELRNAQEKDLGRLRSEFHLFRQETHFYRSGILKRLDGLEEKASKPVIDWQPIIQNLWFKIAVLIALATGNTQLVELVTATFQK